METLNSIVSVLVGLGLLACGVFAVVEYGDDCSEWLAKPKAAFERGVEHRWNHGSSAEVHWDTDFEIPDLPEPPDFATQFESLKQQRSRTFSNPQRNRAVSRPAR
jgi:hypothetical protein